MKTFPVIDEEGRLVGVMTMEEVNDEYGNVDGFDGRKPCWMHESDGLYLRRYVPDSASLVVYRQAPRRKLFSEADAFNPIRFASMRLADIKAAFGKEWTHDPEWRGVYLPPNVLPLWKERDDGTRVAVATHVEVDTRPLADEWLSAYGPEARQYVKEHWYDPETRALVQDELAHHPERYIGMDNDKTKRGIVALANTYVHHDEDLLENLMNKAHLFAFDEDAWLAGCDCYETLTRLPYEACIVSGEQVLLYRSDNGIVAVGLAKGADVERSKRLMSFVVNSCHSSIADGRTAYVADRHPDPIVPVGGITKRSENDQPASTISVGARDHPHDSDTARTHHSPIAHHRRAHWRNQACGPGLKQHRRIFIHETIVMPGGRPYKITNPKRIHRVRLSTNTEVS